jgi:hypothetical protein
VGRLPDFVVIGVMKSGTTSFAAYLDQHPQVAVSKPKEPNFFADPGNWDKGLEWYKSLFPGNVQVVGEASVFYTMMPEYGGAAERIRSTIPEVRLIYLVRDPIERMRSMFIHRADKHQGTGRSLAESIELQPAYVEISRYGHQLEPYLELFGEEQILVLTTDELRTNPDAVLSRAFRHIGVDPAVRVPAEELLNRGDEKKLLGDVGFSLAKAIHVTGVRKLLPAKTRLAIKHRFSRDFTEDVLRLNEATEKRLRNILAPDMEVIRRLVVASGADVPPWLRHQIDPLGSASTG